jgi:DNA-binding transcriptional regulator YiaG
VSNLAGALRDEIRRLARKETRASVGPLRKTVAALRRKVAEQARLIQELKRAAKRPAAAAPADRSGEAEAGPQVRFSPKWVSKHRKKLGMSRRVYAKLIGVSAQTIFGWESGRTRPRRQALQVWRRIRSMGTREIRAMLAAAKPARRKRRAPARRPARVRTRRRAARGPARRAKKK